MKKILLTVFSLTAAALFAEKPSVTVSSVTQDVDSKKVTVNYALAGAPAIVTMSVETNSSSDAWVEVDDSALWNMTGDIGVIISEDSADLKVDWFPAASWPGQMLAEGKARVVLRAWELSAPPPYAVFNLVVSNAVEFYESERQLPRGVKDDIYKKDYLVMRRIPAANVVWRMGSPEGEWKRVASREMPHNVSLSADYYMAVYELTEGQLDRINLTKYPNKSRSRYAARKSWQYMRGAVSDYDFPANGHNVDPNSTIGRLRGHTGRKFDLPTEAQWEYAARAGMAAPFQNGVTDGTAHQAEILPLGWFKENSEVNGTRVIHEVGLCPANDWGLYDIHGNLCEWCLDWMQYDNTGFGPVDPLGPQNPPANTDIGPINDGHGPYKIVRGGGYSEDTAGARFARRGWELPVYTDGPSGIRLCLPADFMTNLK